MADGADARDAAGERPLPPPRARMANENPAPVPRLSRPTGAARTARVLWAASFVAGALVIAIAVIRRTTQFQDLQKYVAGLAPDASSSTVETASAIAFWGALAALAIFT